MPKSVIALCLILAGIVIAISCSKKDSSPADPYAAIKAALNIDPDNLINYAGQTRPAYIVKDNGGTNPITNAKATLGRVLFYDNNLSIDNSRNCASCHKQQFAFGDTSRASSGVQGGITGRHSMRLINSRFAREVKFFWNERAASLEEQTTKPIQDHAEMGFSGQTGRPVFAALITKLQGIGYYNELFKFVYGDATITESRMQECLAQFVRSIQSFDSKYDVGRAQVAADNPPFPNFTPQENQGKNLYLQPPVFDATGNRTGGGIGCNGCHQAPEFDIDPNSRNNGIIASINSPALDLNNTRAPSLRDLVQTNGILNGPMMHLGDIRSLQGLLGHYNAGINAPPVNTNLDPRLRPNGFPQRLNMTPQEAGAVVVFLQTLSGTNVYTDVRWSNPFK